MADRAQIASVNINRIKLVLLRIQMWEQNKLINEKFNQYKEILSKQPEAEKNKILMPLKMRLYKVEESEMNKIKDQLTRLDKSFKADDKRKSTM
jgi:hypothetical protein